MLTTDGPAGKVELTVSAMSPVYADGSRQTLVVCLLHLNPVTPAIIKNRVFYTNQPGTDQVALSGYFAGHGTNEFASKFDVADRVQIEAGWPTLKGALINFDWRLLESLMISTHHIFVAEVLAGRVDGSNKILACSNRVYCRVAAPVWV